MTNSEKSDEELIAQYQMDGNPLSLDILFSRYLDVGFRTAMRYMRNTSDAEDVLQIAFIQFLKNLHQFKAGSITVKPWLMKMIVNTSLTKLTEEKKRKERNFKEGFIRMSEYTKQNNTAEDKNKDLELKETLLKIVESLPEKYKSPISLVLYEGFSYSEVARVLSLPEKTIRTQVSRGLEKIKASLGTIGTVLSVDAIILLMHQTLLDNAPVSAHKIANSKHLFQSNYYANSKRISNRFPVSSKPFFSLFKLSIVSLIAIIVIGFMVHSKIQLSDSSTQTAGFIKQKNLSQTILNKDRTWDFINKSDRDLQLSVGYWEWNESSKGMITKQDQYLIIDLPYMTQEKPLLIESIIIPNMPKNGDRVSLLTTACWKNQQEILEHETYELPKYHLTDLDPISQRTYLYKGYILIFFKEKLLRVKKYSGDVKDANPAIVVKNYIFKKIICKTIDKPTKELIDAIEYIKNYTPMLIKAIPVNEAEITFKTKNDINNYLRPF